MLRALSCLLSTHFGNGNGLFGRVFCLVSWGEGFNSLTARFQFWLESIWDDNEANSVPDLMGNTTRKSGSLQHRVIDPMSLQLLSIETCLSTFYSIEFRYDFMISYGRLFGLVTRSGLIQRQHIRAPILIPSC